MSLGVTKSDHVKSQHIRGPLKIKETVVRYGPFSLRISQIKTMLREITLSIEILTVTTRQRFGLAQEERKEVATMRSVTMGIHPGYRLN